MATHLPGVFERAPEQLFRDGVRINVVKHYRGVIASQLQRNALQGPARRRRRPPFPSRWNR